MVLGFGVFLGGFRVCGFGALGGFLDVFMWICGIWVFCVYLAFGA